MFHTHVHSPPKAESLVSFEEPSEPPADISVVTTTGVSFTETFDGAGATAAPAGIVLQGFDAVGTPNISPATLLHLSIVILIRLQGSSNHTHAIISATLN